MALPDFLYSTRIVTEWPAVPGVRQAQIVEVGGLLGWLQTAFNPDSRIESAVEALPYEWDPNTEVTLTKRQIVRYLPIKSSSQAGAQLRSR